MSEYLGTKKLLARIGHDYSDGLPYYVMMVYCPGCRSTHPYRLVKEGHTEAEVRAIYPDGCWAWNGDPDSPTFTPSLLCNKSMPRYRCHFNIDNGRIKYHDDCHHDLKNTTIDMVPIPEELV